MLFHDVPSGEKGKKQARTYTPMASKSRILLAVSRIAKKPAIRLTAIQLIDVPDVSQGNFGTNQAPFAMA